MHHPTRSPGKPYALDRLPITRHFAMRPLGLGKTPSADRSENTESHNRTAPDRSTISRNASYSPCDSDAPVGLFGKLATTILTRLSISSWAFPILGRNPSSSLRRQYLTSHPIAIARPLYA